MNQNAQQKNPRLQLELAQYEVEIAKRRFSSTLGALQYRLKPGTLANQAWSGVREKSSEVADDALHGVNGMADGAVRALKERPVAASSIAAGILVFLLRAPLWRAARNVFSREEEDPGVVKADLEHHQKEYDLTAPTVERSPKEGVTA